jgi:hypothetical protein
MMMYDASKDPPHRTAPKVHGSPGPQIRRPEEQLIDLLMSTLPQTFNGHPRILPRYKLAPWESAAWHDTAVQS